MTKTYFVNPLNEDDLKILKVEYLSNCLLDHTRMLNLSLDDRTIPFQWKTISNERQPPMKENLQWKTTSNGRQFPMEDFLQRKTTSNGKRSPMEDDLLWKTTSNGRQPPVEDDLQWKTT